MSARKANRSELRTVKAPVLARGESVRLVWGLKRTTKLVPSQITKLSASREMRLAAVAAWCKAQRPVEVPDYNPDYESKPGDGVYDSMAKASLRGIRLGAIHHNQKAVHDWFPPSRDHQFVTLLVPEAAHARDYPRYLAGYRTKIWRTRSEAGGPAL